MPPIFSVIIPTYNESQRLPPYLRSLRAYFQKFWGDQHEVIIVDDGSQDRLEQALAGYLADWHQLVLVKHRTNLGKGAAVRTGMLSSVGEILLFTDADGATPIEEEKKLRAAIELGADVAVGSRFLVGNRVERVRLWHRNFCSRLFAGAAQSLFRLPVRDTQCGFKMFRRSAGLDLFSDCRETGYVFDVEILLSAQQRGYRVAEIPVSWRDVPGSRLRLLPDGWNSFHGLWKLRRSTSCGNHCRGGSALLHCLPRDSGKVNKLADP